MQGMGYLRTLERTMALNSILMNLLNLQGVTSLLTQQAALTFLPVMVKQRGQFKQSNIS